MTTVTSKMSVGGEGVVTSSGGVELPVVHLRIGGQKTLPASGRTVQHVNPVTGQADATVPVADAAAVDDAVQAAHAAFGGWRRTRPARRRELLLRLADLIEAHGEDFVLHAAVENGLPVGFGAGFPALAAAWTRYYASWADKIMGEVTGNPVQDEELSYTLPQPYGVVATIITWNSPLMSIAMKVPAALAAGNTVVIKPSSLTPFTGELFMDPVEEAGFPPGVINVLPGGGDAGDQLVAHPLVRKISFTGGPATATKILRACAETAKPSVMELGGKSADIVFEDADVPAACAFNTALTVGAFAGQGCGLPTRMLVHESIHNEVVERIRGLVADIKIGDPADPAVRLAPVISQAAADRIMGMIERAVADGATLVTGGHRIDRPGFYIEPTVFTDVDPDSEIAQEEVFGPVLVILKFSTEQEAIAIANGTPYGLASYIQTRDLARANRVAAELEAGEVLINGAGNLAPHRPFGGWGISGFGKEGGRAGLEEFLRVKGVGIGVGFMNLDSYRTLGRSGLRVSPVALGAMTFGDASWGADDETSAAIVDRCLEAGGNFLDTANVYNGGRSEETIGAYLDKHPGLRDRLVIATKFGGGLFPGDPNGGGAGRKAIVQQLEGSLRRLSTEYVDLYWLHNFDRHTPLEETVATLDDLVRAGKVRYAGLSDTPAWAVARAATIAELRGWAGVAAVQVQYNLLERTVEGEQFGAVRELGLGVTTWSPLASGVLSGKYTRDNTAPEGSGRAWHTARRMNEATFAVLDVLQAVSDDLGSPMAAVALAWVRQQPEVTSTLFGARTVDQLERNLASLQVTLPAEHLTRLDEATRPQLEFPAGLLRDVAPNYQQAGATINGVTSRPFRRG